MRRKKVLDDIRGYSRAKKKTFLFVFKHQSDFLPLKCKWRGVSDEKYVSRCRHRKKRLNNNLPAIAARRMEIAQQKKLSLAHAPTSLRLLMQRHTKSEHWIGLSFVANVVVDIEIETKRFIDQRQQQKLWDHQSNLGFHFFFNPTIHFSLHNFSLRSIFLGLEEYFYNSLFFHFSFTFWFSYRIIFLEKHTQFSLTDFFLIKLKMESKIKLNFTSTPRKTTHTREAETLNK